MSRPFHFDFDKTTQAVAFLLRRERGHRMNYMRLLKLLYLVEREALAETGKPVTGSHVIAMRRGPVLEDVFALIRGQHHNTPEWAQYFRVDRFDLEMTADPGVGRLSKYLAEKLEEVAERYERMDEWDMVEFTHTLPEWVRNDPGDSSKEIPLEHILEAVGRKADLEKIIAGARNDFAAATFFAQGATTPVGQATP